MERHFDDSLKQLKEKLLLMSVMVEEAISKAIKAFAERQKDLAEDVIQADRNVDMLEIDIENLCIRLLALHQPQAGDLRFITSIMKINTDLERMGDLAVNIAERALDLLKSPPTPEGSHLTTMAKSAQGMLKDSIEAFVNKKADLAQLVCKRDDEVDQLNRQIFQELTRKMQQDHNYIERSIDLILVAKNLEKIADHATNICEDVIYMVNGTVIKHHVADQS